MLKRYVGLSLWVALTWVVPSSAQSSTLSFLQTLKDVPVDFVEAGAVSPDGIHFYLIGDRALTVWEREPSTGGLTLLELHREAKNGVSGLDVPRGLAISPDGRHVYVASRDGQPSGAAVGVFARHLTAGTLTFVGAELAGLDASVSPFDASAIALSRDGRHVYVGNSRGQTLAGPIWPVLTVFSRDATTGSLSLVETQFAGLTALDPELESIADVVVSPDDRHVYVVTFNGLAAFARDPATGSLALVETELDEGLPCLLGARAASISPDGRHLYVAGAANAQLPTGVATFALTPATGELSYSGCQRTDNSMGVGFPTTLSVDADGSYVYVTGTSEGGAIQTLRRDRASGSLSFVDIHIQGQAGVTGLDTPLDLVLSPDGKHAYTISRPAETGIFEREPATGSLSFTGAATFEAVDEVDGIRGPWRAIVSPDGADVYALSLEGSIAHFARGETGTLRFVRALFDDVGGVDGLARPDDLAISQDGRNLYVVSTQDMAVTTFARDLVTGGLTFLQAHPTSTLRFPADVKLSPDDRFLYVAGLNWVTIFARNTASGLLTLAETLWLDDVPTEAMLLSFSPDGRFLYAADDHDLSIFSRDVATGELTLVENDNTLAHNRAMTISPDGRNLYMTRYEPIFGTLSSLRVYERDLTTGALDLIEDHFDGEGGIDSMRAPVAVEVTPDGARVVVVSNRDHALVVFGRDAESGRLSLAEEVIENRNGVDGLTYPNDSAFSPDSRNAYVLSHGENAITTFGDLEPCVPGPHTLCLNGDRFRVEVDWRDFTGATGLAHVVPGTPSADSGLFWFFSPDNWEMLVKVLDGCEITDHFWVFAGATTDIAYTLRVTDTLTGVAKSYTNPLGNAAAAITDTRALAACP